MRIPIARPFFDEDELNILAESIVSGWVSQGPKVGEFERLFTNYVGAKCSSAVSSGSAALHLALLAAGIGPGDEVITSAYTCVATVNPIEMVGARPVLVDISSDTFNIDSGRIEEAITDRTKAIVPVHLFGLCADMQSILEIARSHGLCVVEDAALALGAWHKEAHAGTCGIAGCFSFHPRKIITTGEGGMVITTSPEIDARIKELRNYGASRSAWDRHHGRVHELPEYRELGFNYKLTDLQAGVGIAQLRKLPGILERRRQLAREYDRRLGEVEWLVTPNEPLGFAHAYQSYVCMLSAHDMDMRPRTERLERYSQRRNRLMEQLAGKGIATVSGAQAVHTTSYYRTKYGYDRWAYPNALAADMLSIAFPIFPQLTDEEVAFICDSVKGFTP